MDAGAEWIRTELTSELALIIADKVPINSRGHPGIGSAGRLFNLVAYAQTAIERLE